MFDLEAENYLKVLGLERPIDLRRVLGRAPSRIAIVTTHRLGDMLVTLPAVQAIRDYFGEAKLTMVVSRPQHDLVRSQPFVDAVEELPTEPWGIFDLVQDEDLVLFFRRWDAEQAKQMRPPWYALSTDLLLGPPKPAHLHYLGALRMLGLRPKQRRPCIELGAAERSLAQRWLRERQIDGQRILVAVHPGSYYAGKRWPAERYAQVLEWLWRCYDAHFLLVQGRGEEELTQQVTERVPRERVQVLASQSLVELGAILASSTCYLGNDTGVMHLADAVDLPCVTIFGPSRPHVWGPTGPGSVHLVADEVWRGCTACSSRFVKDKPCARPEDQRCLVSIKVADVTGAIESLAALGQLRARFPHLDGIRLASNLFSHPVGRDGLCLVNLGLLKPLFALRGRKQAQACLEAVAEDGSYARTVKRDRALGPLLDTLLAYRIVVPEADTEPALDPDVRSDLAATFSHPVTLLMGPAAQGSPKRLRWPLPPAPSTRRRFRRRRLRILLVNGIEHIVYGGGERWMLRVGLELKRRGHEVLCWGLSGHQWLSDAVQQGLTCLSGSAPETFEFAEVQSRARHLGRLRLDAAMLAQDRELLSLGLSLRVAGVPVVLARKGLAITDDRPLVRWAHAAVAHGVVAPSERTRYEIARLGWLPLERIRTIANGVDVEELRRKSEGWEVLRDDLGLEPGQPVVLSIGRLSRHKGTVHLVRAFARVVADHPDAQLLLVGVGFRFWTLTQVVAEENLGRSVHFLGERWDAPKLLRLADCFVLPSLYEGMSTALLEAMALSVPVVATAVSGTPEVIEDGKNGYLVPPADPVSLAHAISMLLDDSRQAARMARAALRTVTRRHSFQRMVDAVEEILHQGW